MAAWVPQLVVRNFMQTVLRADAAVLAEVDADHILPDVGIPVSEERTLTHELVGPGQLAAAIGGSITMATLPWDITGWEPSYSRLSLNGLMVAVKATLIGANMGGKRHLFSFGGMSFAIECDQKLDDPMVPIRLDQTAPQTWAPVRERYRIFVVPRAA